MRCTSVTGAMSFNISSSGKGSTPTLDQNTVKCQSITGTKPLVSGVDASAWQWTGTLRNVPDGILTITVTNPVTEASGVGTGVS